MDGDDRGVVLGAELGLADGAPDEGRVVADDGFYNCPVAPVGFDLVDLVCRGLEALDLEQVHDGLDNTDELEAVAGLEDLFGADRGEGVGLALDLGQEESRELAEARALDAFADERARGLDLDLDGVAPGLVALLARREAFGEHEACDERDEREAEDRGGDADDADPPEAFERRGHGQAHGVEVGGVGLVVGDVEAVDSDVRAGADECAGAAEDGGEREGHKEA